MTDVVAGIDGARSQPTSLSEYLWSGLLWLLLAAIVELAWVFAQPATDAKRGHLLAPPYNLVLVLLAGIAPAFAKHRYLVWFAAAMPLWILIVVVIGARH